MDNNFSSGPWDVEELLGGHNFSIYQVESFVHIANVGDSQDSDHGVLPGNNILANAYLIAAAPDLLEMLQLALPYIRGAYECAFPDWEENVAIAQKAEAVINKALNK